MTPNPPAPPRRNTRYSRELITLAGTAALLPSATLEVVVAAAGLQTRLDRKYLVAAEDLVELADHLFGRMHVLEIGGRRHFRYESVYFDTGDLQLYRHQLQGRRHRYKVRTRSYLDSGECMFEVKLKSSRGQTIKARMPYQIADRNILTRDAKTFLADLLNNNHHTTPPDLQPVTTIRYTRTTLVDFGEGTRPTLDVDLTCSRTGLVVHGSGHILIETKGTGFDSTIDRALRKLGARPVSISKYSLAVAALYPDVPANPLHHTMRRYFNWQPARHNHPALYRNGVPPKLRWP